MGDDVFVVGCYTCGMTRLTLVHERLSYSVSVPVFYKGEEVAHQRLDMIVDHKLVVETKSTRALHDGAVRQVENYLRATTLELGLLLHFGPQPKFYRVIATKSRTPDPKSPLPPVPQFPRVSRNPFVGVASGGERTPTSDSVSAAIPDSEPKC